VLPSRRKKTPTRWPKPTAPLRTLLAANSCLNAKLENRSVEGAIFAIIEKTGG